MLCNNKLFIDLDMTISPVNHLRKNYLVHCVTYHSLKMYPCKCISKIISILIDMKMLEKNCALFIQGHLQTFKICNIIFLKYLDIFFFNYFEDINSFFFFTVFLFHYKKIVFDY